MLVERGEQAAVNVRVQDDKDHQYIFQRRFESLYIWLNAYHVERKTQQTFLAVFSKSLKPQSIRHIISVQNLDEKKSLVFEFLRYLRTECRFVDEYSKCMGVKLGR